MSRIINSEYSLRSVILKCQIRYTVSIGKIAFYLHPSRTKIMPQKYRCFKLLLNCKIEAVI